MSLSKQISLVPKRQKGIARKGEQQPWSWLLHVCSRACWGNLGKANLTCRLIDFACTHATYLLEAFLRLEDGKPVAKKLQTTVLSPNTTVDLGLG